MFERQLITKPSDLRLDAAESVWFKRQLEYVDKTQYDVLFPPNKSRILIPTQPGVPDWAPVYVHRLFNKVGKAKIISNMADDLPNVDVTGEERPMSIKPVGDSFGWDIFEIKAAAATGVPLDAMRAAAARFAIETEIDSILAVGNTLHGLDGLLSLSGTNTVTPIAKSGGGTTWANATPAEIATDIRNAINANINASKGAGGPAFEKFVVVIPTVQYGLIAQMQMSEADSTTVLTWLKTQNPFIEDIVSWHMAAGAGAGATDRMAVYVRNPIVLAGLVPMEYTQLEPEKRGLRYVVAAIATTGGVVVRYLFLVCYVDGI